MPRAVLNPGFQGNKHTGMPSPTGRSSRGRNRDTLTPLLVFFSARRSGPARRMDSLLAHLARRERGRLRVLRVDVDDDPDTARRFNVNDVPALVLVKGSRVVGRFDGRAKASDIEELVEPYLAGKPSPDGR
jgi:thioredoxin 1